jgi:site-specific DNA recombinase
MNNPPTLVRCAIYTRKSTEEGLQQEFNSLDAQREAGEAFIKSQASTGWICSPVVYDDGGFTGGNLERPALQRLMADIEAGKVDCVVVYKVDRLSRSLLDFARLMEVFDKKQVAFVSVTQQFNTATSMGRLVLNVLLSFAQFEREIIAERTRDKIAATRRKGKWSGGMPLLGYDVDPKTFKLVVNQHEAERVRAIFDLYLEQQGLIRVVQELERRGWRNKLWQTRKGRRRGGSLFTKTTLHHLLSNVVYLGKVRYKKEIHPGEHQAIVDQEAWQQAQDLLHRRGNATLVRRNSSALLKGLLHCKGCGSAMTVTSAQKNGGKRYDYYVCQSVIKRGRQACSARSLPRAIIESWVIERVRESLADAQSPENDTLLNNDPTGWVRTRVDRVDYDSTTGRVSITLGEESLAQSLEVQT